MKITNILIVLLMSLGITVGAQASTWINFDVNEVAATQSTSDYYFDEGNYEDH